MLILVQTLRYSAFCISCIIAKIWLKIRIMTSAFHKTINVSINFFLPLKNQALVEYATHKLISKLSLLQMYSVYASNSLFMLVVLLSNHDWNHWNHVQTLVWPMPQFTDFIAE